jgi:hypothetical protein
MFLAESTAGPDLAQFAGEDEVTKMETQALKEASLLCVEGEFYSKQGEYDKAKARFAEAEVKFRLVPSSEGEDGIQRAKVRARTEPQPAPKPWGWFPDFL